jgi:hypothetical protein
MSELFSNLVDKYGILKASVISSLIGLFIGFFSLELIMFIFQIIMDNVENIHINSFSCFIADSKYTSSFELVFLTFFTAVAPLSYMLKEE